MLHRVGTAIKTRRSCTGFNIVEILVALAILAIGIYSAADMIVAARHTSQLTEGRMQASSLAQLKIEELRSAADNLPALFPNHAAGSIDLPAGQPGVFEQNPAYSWRAHLDFVQGGIPQVVLKVEVARAGDSASSAPLAQVTGLALPNVMISHGVVQ